MPSTIAVSNEARKFLEKIRKEAPGDRVPPLKEITEDVFTFVIEHEAPFKEWLKKHPRE